MIEADLERELKKARYMERAAHRHALQAEADRDAADARLAGRNAQIARLAAQLSARRVTEFDEENAEREVALKRLHGKVQARMGATMEGDGAADALDWVLQRIDEEMKS